MERNRGPKVSLFFFFFFLKHNIRREKRKIVTPIIVITPSPTVILSARVNRSIVGHPLIHLYELGHETRYLAFHDRAVRPYHVLVLGLGDVELRNDCPRGHKQAQDQRSYRGGAYTERLHPDACNANYIPSDWKKHASTNEPILCLPRIESTNKPRVRLFFFFFSNERVKIRRRRGEEEISPGRRAN